MPIKRDNKKMNKIQTSSITLKNRFAVLNEDEPEQVMDLENDEPKQEKPTKKKEKPPPIVIHGNSNSHTELIAKIKRYVKEKFFVRYAINRFSIHTSTPSDYKELIRNLDENTQYHTHTNRKDKTS